jgi:hypothetical protein
MASKNIFESLSVNQGQIKMLLTFKARKSGRPCDQKSLQIHLVQQWLSLHATIGPLKGVGMCPCH